MPWELLNFSAVFAASLDEAFILFIDKNVDVIVENGPLGREIGAVLSKRQGHLSMLGCTGSKPIKVGLLCRCRIQVACAKNLRLAEHANRTPHGLHYEPGLYVTCTAKLHLLCKPQRIICMCVHEIYHFDLDFIMENYWCQMYCPLVVREAQAFTEWISNHQLWKILLSC